MTIVCIEEQLIVSGGKNKRRKILLRCDECQKEYYCQYSKSRALKSKLHFCSKTCSSKSMSNGKLKQKTHDELRNKYGSSYVNTDKFKTEREELWLRRYGVKNILKAPAIREKIKQTNLKKYGREVYAGSDDWESKLDRGDIARKSWLTKIANGTCSKSLVEERINNILTTKFGEANVKRQVPLIGQWIDFEILIPNFYLQVDGVYWHGLNRDIDIIKQGTSSQDQKIYKQILRDEKLNEYMKNKNMVLLRITDETINLSSDEEIFKLISEKI